MCAESIKAFRIILECWERNPYAQDVSCNKAMSRKAWENKEVERIEQIHKRKRAEFMKYMIKVNREYSTIWINKRREQKLMKMKAPEAESSICSRKVENLKSRAFRIDKLEERKAISCNTWIYLRSGVSINWYNRDWLESTTDDIFWLCKSMSNERSMVKEINAKCEEKRWRCLYKRS